MSFCHLWRPIYIFFLIISRDISDPYYMHYYFDRLPSSHCILSYEKLHFKPRALSYIAGVIAWRPHRAKLTTNLKICARRSSALRLLGLTDKLRLRRLTAHGVLFFLPLNSNKATAPLLLVLQLLLVLHATVLKSSSASVQAAAFLNQHQCTPDNAGLFCSKTGWKEQWWDNMDSGRGAVPQ